MNKLEKSYILTPKLPIIASDINYIWDKISLRSRFLLLIDKQGSMIPFHLEIDAIVNSLLLHNLANKVGFYYFHNCPDEFIYKTPDLIEAIPTAVVLSQEAKDNSVLIISDAGAARGFHDRQRVLDTKLFINNLEKYTRQYAWLNPMPQDRWYGTTAEDIADILPMFFFNQEGLINAMNF